MISYLVGWHLHALARNRLYLYLYLYLSKMLSFAMLGANDCQSVRAHCGARSVGPKPRCRTAHCRPRRATRRRFCLPPCVVLRLHPIVLWRQSWACVRPGWFVAFGGRIRRPDDEWRREPCAFAAKKRRDDVLLQS